MTERIAALRRRLRRLGLANFLVTRTTNVRYLCGFTGSNAVLLVTPASACLITDGRYTTQAREEVKGAEVFIYAGGNSVPEGFAREIRHNPAIRFRGRLGVEAAVMTLEWRKVFGEYFPRTELVETINVVEELAMVKDAGEVALIRRAADITDRVFASLLPDLKPGVRERDIAAEITYRQLKLGAEKDGFDPIVASGPRAALPHGVASDRKIRKGDLVTLDFGCVVEGYPSDLTRTVVVGRADRKQRKVYELVKRAQEAAVAAVRAGVRCSAVDAAAREVITAGGYGPQFSHGTGHGLGLWDRQRQVHALPVLSRTVQTVLKPGMVVTVEPGIYVEGWGGVRIEDDVVVTEGGAEVLTRSTRELVEL